jgi:membrane protein
MPRRGGPPGNVAARRRPASAATCSTLGRAPASPRADGPAQEIAAMRKLFELVKETVRDFIDEDPFTMAGALSYYTLLSLAPLLLMVVAVAGLVYGEEAARGEVLAKFELAVGPEAASMAQQVLAHAHEQGSGVLSAIVAGVGLIVGATTAFSQLQAALDKIWDVKAPPRPWWALLRGRLLSFAFVVLLGVTVVASLVASSVITALSARITGGVAIDWLWRLVDIAVPLVLMTALFAVLFKLLPDAIVRWRDVWVGAALTSLLFAVGRVAIGFYLGRSGVGSAYGAAGSVIVLMAWIYYSSVIVLFGAELTQVYAGRYGSKVVARYGAEEARAAARA